MSTNRITIAGIVGQSARALAAELQPCGQQARVSSATWERRQRMLLAKQCELRANADRAPIIFWREYVDQWSPLLALTHYLKGPLSVQGILVMSLSTRRLKSLIPSLRRRVRSRSSPQEAKWFIQAVLDCSGALSPWGDGQMIIIGQTLGPSVLDEDVTKSKRTLANWGGNRPKRQSKDARA